MTTVVNNLQIVPRQPAAAPALRAADQGVASALSDNTRRVYGAQWSSGGCSTTGATRWVSAPYRRNR